MHLEREEQAQALISCLPGEAFEFYYTGFTAQGVLTDNNQRYKVVKEVLKELFDRKQDLKMASIRLLQ